jgi:hypothetical protein
MRLCQECVCEPTAERAGVFKKRFFQGFCGFIDLPSILARYSLRSEIRSEVKLRDCCLNFCTWRSFEMIYARRYRAAWLFAALATVIVAGPAHAATITLGTSSSLTLQQGASGTFTFTAANDAGAITNFLGWTLGIQVLPAGTTSGSISIGSLLVPSANPILSGTLGGNIDFTAPTVGTLANSGTINGSTQFTFFGMSANDEFRTVNASTTYNLAALSFLASPTASGTWNVYAVQQQGPTAWKSYWTDENLTDTPFGNWPSSPVGNTAVLVGTITAVPEPSTIALLGMSVASAGWYAWRSRRKVTIETVESA